VSGVYRIVVDGKVIVIVGGPKARGTGAVAVTRRRARRSGFRDGGKESLLLGPSRVDRGKSPDPDPRQQAARGLVAADGAALWERKGEDENIIPMIQPTRSDAGLLPGLTQVRT
jgi:hypothetical protein